VAGANNQDGQSEDFRTPDTFAIATDAKASPVVVALWDCGVDLSLFKPAALRGLAFDDEARPAKELLRSLCNAQARWPQLRGLVTGAMDQRAALDTADAQRLRATLAGLKAEQFNRGGSCR
jgi:hypothetical protein